MLTITIFATIVSDMLPVSNNTPLIGGIATIIVKKVSVGRRYASSNYMSN